MQIIRKSRASALLAKVALENLIRARVLNRDLILPFLTVYHANYACNADCSFCSRADDIAGAGKDAEIALDEIEGIFHGLRTLTPALYVPEENRYYSVTSRLCSSSQERWASGRWR